LGDFELGDKESERISHTLELVLVGWVAFVGEAWCGFEIWASTLVAKVSSLNCVEMECSFCVTLVNKLQHEE
jgi:hypothetical protein